MRGGTIVLAGIVTIVAWMSSAAWRPSERWRGFNIVTRIYNDRNEFREDDFKLIRQLGFNFARVTLNYRHWIVDEDWNRIDDTKLVSVDRAVEYGRKYGVHVQLCFHRAPGWCVASWPVEPKNLFKDAEPLEVCAKHWRHFAERYKDVPPEALSFNLVNEPGASEDAYARVARRLIAEIHAVSPERFIMSDGLGIARRPCVALLGMPGVGQATRGYQPTDVSLYNCPWGSPMAREPKWPCDPCAPIGNFLGPNKRLTHGDHPLALENLPTGMLGFVFGIINGKVTFEVVADGERVAEWELEPKTGDPQWEGYKINKRWKTASARFTGTREVELKKPAKRVEVRVSKGDWACIWDVTFRADGAATEARFPIYVEFGAHVNYVQRYDVKKNRFHPVPDPGDENYARKYADDGLEYLYRHIFRYWNDALARGEFAMIGEFAVWKKTPHPVALALMEDYLKLAKERDMGWALWQFRGEHGVCNSGRTDIEYEDIPDFPDYKLDRKMYELLKKY